MINIDITNSADIIDVRDIIKRVEELTYEYLADYPDEVHERDELTALLDDLKGYGGDELWRGDWYPVTLVRDSHFTEYAQQLAEDIGTVKSNAEWPHNCIDWDRASTMLQQDYSAVDYAGTTYWYR